MRHTIGLALLGLLALGSCNLDDEQANDTSIRISDERIDLRIDGRPLLSYHLTPVEPANSASDSLPDYYRRSGFIHPVYSPSGKVITDDFPVGHAHQHGIFTAWTKTRFRGRPVDFWNQQNETGTVRHAELLEVIDSAGVIGFRARLEHISLADSVVLEEEWHLRAYEREPPYIFDLRSEQTNVTQDTLYLEQHVYGGLGVRGNAAWNEADTESFRGPARFLTSAGNDRSTANHTRPKWVAIHGEINGDVAGIATLGHPDNFRARQFVRVHPEMPYYSVTPVVEAGFKIAPGDSYLSRYRFVVFDGAPDSLDLDRFGWDETLKLAVPH